MNLTDEFPMLLFYDNYMIYETQLKELVTSIT